MRHLIALVLLMVTTAAHAALSINFAWDYDDPAIIERYELYTWINNGQVEQHTTTVLPDDANPYNVIKQGTIGDELHAKVRACDASQCSPWSGELVHVITETQVITLSPPSSIRIEIIVQ
jgi:hypothetical protein